MKLVDLHPTIQMALALHEALRRLGIHADDIYLIVSPVQGCLVQARQGSDVCNFAVGEVPPDFTPAAWAASVRVWNSGSTPEEKAEMWEECRTCFNATLLIKCLHDTGFLLKSDTAMFENAAQA